MIDRLHMNPRPTQPVTLRVHRGRPLVFLLTICFVTASLAGCITTPPDPTPFFVTATLPPTNTSFPARIVQPQTITPPAILQTNPPNCKEAAILLQDVTIADGTNVPAGIKFTKTWKFQNAGTCIWSGYTIAFTAGDRMNAPDASPIPQTAPNGTADVSVELAAPASDGAYTGYFELRDPAGRAIPIGSENSFWVKIAVGQAEAAQATSSNPIIPPGCNYIPNEGYVNQIIGLINSARAQANLPALTVNPQLASAAQCHSVDMACHNFLGHNGSDGSPIGGCLRASGYPSAGFSEIIAIGDPQYAMDSWMNEPGHRDIVLSPNLTEFGVGYAYVSSSNFGGYYTVDFGGQ